MSNVAYPSVFVTSTIPPGKEMLISECTLRGIDKRTLQPLNPRTCFMVLFASTPGTRPGIITIKPEDFIKKYWVGRELKDKDEVVTFVGYIFTINGNIVDLVEWAKGFDKA
jgi:hypothetical protein